MSGPVVTTYERVFELPLTIEEYSLEGRERAVSPEFTRVTTTFHLRGAGEEGVGEDVTYDADAQREQQARGPSLPLAGEWTFGRQGTVLNTTPGRIVYRFHARDVHLVMGPSAAGSAVRFRVSIDGEAPGSAHGLDIDEDGNGTLTEPRLHQLVRQRTPIVDRTFAIDFLDTGVEAFSFTFG